MKGYILKILFIASNLIFTGSLVTLIKCLFNISWYWLIPIAFAIYASFIKFILFTIIPKFESISNVEDPTTPNTNVEFHVFLQNGAYVDTLYNAEYSIQNKIIDGSSRNYVLLDVHKHLEQAKIVPGTYKIVYNFLSRNAVFIIGRNECHIFCYEIVVVVKIAPMIRIKIKSLS